MKKFFVNVCKFLKKYLTIVIILVIFMVLFICDNSSSRVGSSIMDNLRSIATSFTPTTDLFDDGSEVSFVSYFFGLKVQKKAPKAEFFVPCEYQNMSSSDDFMCYNYDGVIRAISSGVVKSIGYTIDNEKYIEIEHNEGYVSRYVGLLSLGVSTGDKVNAKSPIGILSKDITLKIYIHKNQNLIKISEIEWEK